ncbi:MAG: carbamoyl-phosphate synthase small subunit [Bacteroidetes bacterium]|nr:MAG: carbamoyl-phosphate synthase small subunit [Bacteroidota bacterium]
MNKAFLVLADGMTLEGQAIGKKGTTTGELCFNTGLTGYQEIYSDPSYFGQIIINTNTHIGNYGVLEAENESSKAQVSGMVCNAFSNNYSRAQADDSLQNYLEKNEIVSISNIDTRALVKHLRRKGAMNAIISSEIFDIDELKKQLTQTPKMLGMELSSKVSTQKPYFYGNENAAYKVAVLDLGIKTNILRNFEKRNIFAQVFPAKTSFDEMEKFNPDGYFISNGPGDPSVMGYAIDTVKEILKADKPIFGICLGHQILALANGVNTYKMHNGHRGLNHPVKNILTGKSEITSQNHGFSVVKEDVLSNNNLIITHINLNDDTIEGIKLKNKKAFSVQYHPEAAPGPHDSNYLFDQFVDFF